MTSLPISDLTKILELMDKFTVTSIKWGDLVIERPPLLPKQASSPSLPDLEQSSSDLPTTPEELEARLHALGTSLD